MTKQTPNACPWCGDVAEVHNYDRIAFVECTCCGARGPSVVNDNQSVAENNDEAISAWHEVAEKN